MFSSEFRNDEEKIIYREMHIARVMPTVVDIQSLITFYRPFNLFTRIVSHGSV